MKHMVNTATMAVTPATAERDAAHWDEALPRERACNFLKDVMISKDDIFVQKTQETGLEYFLK